MFKGGLKGVQFDNDGQLRLAKVGNAPTTTPTPAEVEHTPQLSHEPSLIPGVIGIPAKRHNGASSFTEKLFCVHCFVQWPSGGSPMHRSPLAL